MSKAKEFSTVKLRCVSWSGPALRLYDVLQTKSRRRYEIHKIAGKTLHCVVIPMEAKLAEKARVFDWHWMPRGQPGRRLPR
jgi:hypothetical protein